MHAALERRANIPKLLLDHAPAVNIDSSTSGDELLKNGLSPR
jgi:hypothetical protein